MQPSKEEKWVQLEIPGLMEQLSKATPKDPNLTKTNLGLVAKKKRTTKA